MNGHLCRCGTYPRVIKAIQRASQSIAAAVSGTEEREIAQESMGGGGAMSKLAAASKPSPKLPRREFLKAGGALVIGFSSVGLINDALFAQGPAIAAWPPDPKQIDTWLAIHADNTATVYIGFAELGQGSTTSLLQIAAEELDLDMSQVNTVRLDTNITPNQGGTYSSASIARGGRRFARRPPRRGGAARRWRRRSSNAPVEQLHGLEGRGVRRIQREIRHLRRAGRRQAVQSGVHRNGAA